MTTMIKMAMTYLAILILLWALGGLIGAMA